MILFYCFKHIFQVKNKNKAHLFLWQPRAGALTFSSCLGASCLLPPRGAEAAFVPLFCRSPKTGPLGLKSPTSLLRVILVAFPDDTRLLGSAWKLVSPCPLRVFIFKNDQGKKKKNDQGDLLNIQFKTERPWRHLLFSFSGSPDSGYELDICPGVLPLGSLISAPHGFYPGPVPCESRGEERDHEVKAFLKSRDFAIPRYWMWLTGMGNPDLEDNGVCSPKSEIQTRLTMAGCLMMEGGFLAIHRHFPSFLERLLPNLKLAILSEKKNGIVFSFIAKLQRHLLVRRGSYCSYKQSSLFCQSELK